MSRATPGLRAQWPRRATGSRRAYTVSRGSKNPALYYWAAAVGFQLHLPAEWAARLPSAFAALAASLAIGWLAWEHYDHDASSLSSPALLAPLMFSSSVAAIGFARAGTPDMLFSASIALAMASAACGFDVPALCAPSTLSLSEPHSDLLPLILFGAFLGLAVLAKGPAAIVLAGGAIGLWALAQNSGGRHFVSRIPLRSPHSVSSRFPGIVMRAPQSGFPPRFYFSKQFRTVSHSYVSASPTILVFRSDRSTLSAPPVDRAALALGTRGAPRLA